MSLNWKQWIKLGFNTRQAKELSRLDSGGSGPLLIGYCTQSASNFPDEIYIRSEELTGWGDAVSSREITVAAGQHFGFEVDVVSGDYPTLTDVRVTIQKVRDNAGTVSIGATLTARSSTPVPTGEAVAWDTWTGDTADVELSDLNTITFLENGTYRVAVKVVA